ncbi:MAG: SIR2 family protein [Kiritimatiellales bacterium]
MKAFDPKDYIRGLQQILINDKKRIGFLFGAGISIGAGIPAIDGLTKKVIDSMSGEPKFQDAVESIKSEIGADKYNVESLLSNVSQKKQIIGRGNLNGLNISEFTDLETKIKQGIINEISIHTNACFSASNLAHTIFARWIASTNRKYPIEVFTTNNDVLLELAMEEVSLPFYDGFSGSYESFFDEASVENMKFLPQWTKLWKIHGSLGWKEIDRGKKIIRKNEGNNINAENTLIYPSVLKYEESRKLPYASLMDRLKNFIRQDDTILFTCGYSFGDEHINNVILNALKESSSSHVIAFLYDKTGTKPHTYSLSGNHHVVKLAQSSNRVSIYACRNAVIGCRYGKWKLMAEPDKQDTIDINHYYDEDAPVLDTMGEQPERITPWSGEGELMLPDFSKLVEFLQYMIPETSIGKYKNE